MNSKTLNFYCDESTHLLKDGFPYMILSYICSPYNRVKYHNENIREIKIKHFYKGEMKWGSLSKSQYLFYNDIIDYFFNSELQFRAIIIDKLQLKHDIFNQSHDEFYDKMYFQLLNKKIFSENNYNIYIDVKDTNSYKRAKGLKNYLERDYHNINNLQVIKSYESELLQLADVLMGAINYKLRKLDKVTAKNNIIAKIEKYCGKSIIIPTNVHEDKFNLFFINLK